MPVRVQLSLTVVVEREQLAAQVESITWLSWTDGPTGSVDRGELIGRLQQTGRTITGQPLAEFPGNVTPGPEQPSTPRPSAPARQLTLE